MTQQERQEFDRMIEDEWQRAAESMPTRTQIDDMEKYHEYEATQGKWGRNCECPSCLL